MPLDWMDFWHAGVMGQVTRDVRSTHDEGEMRRGLVSQQPIFQSFVGQCREDLKACCCSRLKIGFYITNVFQVGAGRRCRWINPEIEA